MATVNFALDEEYKKLLDDIKEVSDVFLVGGAVRDFLRTGAFENDLDVTTNIPTEDLMSHLESKGYRVIPTGIKFGTFQVLLPSGETVDVARFRSEVYKIGDRHPMTTPVKTIEEDLARRDSPMNAFALKYNGTDEYEVIDPYGGLEDLTRG